MYDVPQIGNQSAGKGLFITQVPKVFFYYLFVSLTTLGAAMEILIGWFINYSVHQFSGQSTESLTCTFRTSIQRSCNNRTVINLGIHR